MQRYKSLEAGICRQLLCSHTSHENCAETQHFSSGTTVKMLIRNEDPFSVFSHPGFNQRVAGTVQIIVLSFAVNSPQPKQQP